MRTATTCLTTVFCLALGACRPPAAAPAPAPMPAPAPSTSVQVKPWTVTPTGLGIRDLVVGGGPAPRTAQTCVVEVLAWIEQDGKPGTLFMDTRKRGWPATFPLGVKRVIPAWEEGIATMKVGGKRLLRVPPALGYTAREAGQDIPPDATLLFELELVELR